MPSSVFQLPSLPRPRLHPPLLLLLVVVVADADPVAPSCCLQCGAGPLRPSAAFPLQLGQDQRPRLARRPRVHRPGECLWHLPPGGGGGGEEANESLTDGLSGGSLDSRLGRVKEGR